jgi:hypothetical protein
MEVKLSPIPGWAWDLIETVERGEQRPLLVRGIIWRQRRSAYTGAIKRAKSRTLSPESRQRALEHWEKQRALDMDSSSGHANWYTNVITINAGDNDMDTRMVVLHEMAHLLGPVGVYHERPWVKWAARLYTRYGDPELIAYAIANERRGGEPLRKLLRKHQAVCVECQSYKAWGVVKAVKGLLADLAEMPAVVTTRRPSSSETEPA